MTGSAQQLYDLLPPHYRERDTTGALREYLEVLSEELVVVADGIDQLYDDLFVETAAAWVLPYIADLIGLKGLPGTPIAGLTSRSEVANTIAYRRRKGTAAVLEQVARDATGWPARAVEYFELLTGVQYVNHVRPHAQATASVREAARLQFVNGPFEARPADAVGGWFSHVPEVRRIATAHGRYNIPNVGVHLWRLQPYPVSSSPARAAAAGDTQRFLFDPLGAPVQLFSLPVTESEITHSAEPVNLPLPLTRLLLHEKLSTHYGPGLSLFIDDVVPTPQGSGGPRVIVEAANLADHLGSWGNLPVSSAPDLVVRIDPVRGRIAFSEAQNDVPIVTFHRGFSADLGGGEYDRVQTFATTAGSRELVAHGGVLQGTAMHSTIAAALTALAGGGTVEIADSHVYGGPLAITSAGPAIQVRGADGRRPVVSLRDDLEITLAGDATVSLNGLIIAGGGIRVRGEGRLELRHCTLIPGRRVRHDGTPWRPGVPSIFVESPGVSVTVERCILGGIRSDVDSDVTLVDSIIDARPDGVAFASNPDAGGTDAVGPGGTATFDECTILGRVHARILSRLSNSILVANVPAAEVVRWPGPVLVDRRQEGCVRFSYLPAASRVPRRYHCIPDEQAGAMRPVFTSTRYGEPGYAQLDPRTPESVWRGADDESELGALHHLNQPLRQAYLARRLEDYTRFGLEVGLLFAT